MTLARLFKNTLAATAVAVAFAPTALAHEGPIGDGEQFRVEMSTVDPTGITSRWGHGEVEFHVEPGIELVVIGLEKEPMVKIDVEGNMFANENSPTWWANQPGGKVPATATAVADSNWVWKKGGGSLQYNDFRFRFMGGSVDPTTAIDGAVFLEFVLPIIVDGAETELRGAVVYDSTFSQPAPETMELDDSMVVSPAPEVSDGKPATNKKSRYVLLGFVVLGAVSGVAVLINKKRRSGNSGQG